MFLWNTRTKTTLATDLQRWALAACKAVQVEWLSAGRPEQPNYLHIYFNHAWNSIQKVTEHITHTKCTYAYAWSVSFHQNTYSVANYYRLTEAQNWDWPRMRQTMTQCQFSLDNPSEQIGLENVCIMSVGSGRSNSTALSDTYCLSVASKLSTAAENVDISDRSPNVGSLLHPFKRTPLDVVSMRKCLTSSASRSPPNITFTTTDRS